MNLLRVWLAGLLFVSAFAHSDNIDTNTNLAKYVSVTLEVQGLNESTLALQEVMATLSSSMEGITQSPENLSPEQILALSVLVEKSDKLVMSIERTLQEVEPLIDRAKKPSNELLSTLLHTTRSEIVDPTIQSVKDTVGFWIYLFVFGGIVIVALIAYSFYLMTKRIREMVVVAKSITEEYEIVRRQS